jgi:hypothetical protein
LSSKAAIADRLVHRSKALANLDVSNHNRYQVISQSRQAKKTSRGLRGQQLLALCASVATRVRSLD